MTSVPQHSDVEAKIFTAIEAERKERRTDIAEIHSRIDQVLELLRRLGERPIQNNTSVLVLFATVVVSFGGVLGLSIQNVAKTDYERYQHMNEIVNLRHTYEKEVDTVRHKYMDMIAEMNAEKKR